MKYVRVCDLDIDGVWILVSGKGVRGESYFERRVLWLRRKVRAAG